MSTGYSLFAKLGFDLSDFRKGVEEMRSQLRNVSNEARNFDRSWNGLSQVGQRLSGLGETLTKSISLPLAAIGGLALKTSVDFESAFAGVRKTVDATETEFASLERGIRDMALAIPASTSEIAKVAEAAGQLGIRKESILDFTRTMVDLGVATNLTADQAATMLARFANVTGLPQTQFQNLGSTIVALGNNFATTEAEIVAMGQRLAAAGTIAGVSAPELMGFAAALTSVGIEAEAGGSAFSKMFAQINTAVMSGGSELQKFAQVAGMSADEFASAYRDNASDAIATFIEGLKGIMDSGGNVYEVLADLEIQEVRMLNAMLSTAGAGDLLRRSLDLANGSFRENNALTKEAEQRYQTTESKIKIFRNNLTELGITIGDSLKPALRMLIDFATSVVEVLQGMANKFASLPEPVRLMVAALGGIAVAAGPVLFALGQLAAAVPSVISGFTLLKGAAGTVGPVFTSLIGSIPLVGTKLTGLGSLLGGVAGKFTLLLGPIGLAVAAIAAVGTAVMLLYDDFDDFLAKNPAMERAFDSLKRAGTNLSTAFKSIGIDFSKVWDGILKVVQSVVTVVTSLISGLVENLASAFSSVFKLLKGDFEGAMADFQGIFKRHSSVVKDISEGLAITWETDAQRQKRAMEEQQQSMAELAGSVTRHLSQIDAMVLKHGDGYPVAEEKARQLQQAIKHLVDEGYSVESTEVKYLQSLYEKYAAEADVVIEKKKHQQEQAEKTAQAVSKIAEGYANAMAAFDREIELGIRFSEDGKRQVERDMHEIATLISSLKSAAADISVNIDSEPIVQMRQRLKELLTSLAETRSENGALITSQVNLTGHLKSSADSLKAMSREVSESISKTRDLSDATGGMSSTMRDFADELGRISLVTKDGSFEQWRLSLTAAKNALEAARDSAGSTKEEIDGLRNAVEELERPIPAIAKALRSMFETGRLADIFDMNKGNVLASLADTSHELMKMLDVSPKLAKAFDIVGGALSALGQSGVSTGQKIQDMVEQGVRLIPGIGEVLSSVLRIMDSVGLGFDDMGRMIANAFRPARAGDNAAEWFREVERMIRAWTDEGIDAGEMLANLKIRFPDISEETLKALVEGTSEAFADYNRWLATPNNGLGKGAKTISDMLIAALESGMTEAGAIQDVISKLFAMSSADIEKLTGINKTTQKVMGYDGMAQVYKDQMNKMLAMMAEYGVEFGKKWEDMVDPAEQAAIELEAALVRIDKSLEKNLSLIAERLKAGIITQDMADTSVIREYERAIDAMLDAGLKADDPRVVAMLDVWKSLGGGAKDAAGKTDEAVDEIAEALKKQDAAYAAASAKLAKLQEDNAALIGLGVKTQADAQKELLRAYERAIEDLVDAGLKADDPRLMGMVEAWKSLGGSVEDATGKVKEAVDEHDKAAEKLQSTYDGLSATVSAEMEKIRKSWETGSTDALSAMQEEAILLRDAVEEMLAKGMNGDDPRIAAWQERLSQINMNLRELGQATYDVIEPTDKVGQAWREAGEKLAETLDYIAKRETAGLFAKETDSLREQANAYKRAVEDFLKTGDPDDPRIQGWLDALRQINERLTATGESAVEVKDKFELAADAIKAKLDEKLGNLDFDMRFNFEGAEDDLDVQIEKIKQQMKAVNDAITKAGEEGLDKQGEFVQSLIEKYNELFEQLGEAEWQKSQDAVNNLFDTTEKKLGDLEAKYKLFGDTQEYLADKMKLLKDSMNALLAENVSADDERMLELSAQYKAAAEAAKAYADSQKQIEEAIKGAIAAGGDEAATNSALITLGNAAIELWTVVNEHVQKTAAEAVTWMGSWSQQVMKVFADALTDSKTLRDGIIADQQEAFGVFVNLLQVTWGQTWSQYNSLMRTIREFAETTDYADPALRTINAISGSFAFMLDQFSAQFRTAYGAVEEFSKLAKVEFDHTLGYAKELANAMVDAFRSAAEQIKGAIGDLGTVTVSFTGGPSGEGGIPGMATGGIVPAGFPNDTYPALLTSGEMVIPKPHPLPNMSGTAGSVINHITVVLDGERIQEFTTRGVVDTLRRAGIA